MATFSCPSCHKSVRVAVDNPEGRRFRCNHCNTVFRAGSKGNQPAAAAAPAKEKSAAAPAAKDKPPAPVAEKTRPGAIKAAPDKAAAAPQPRPKPPLDDDDDTDAAPEGDEDWAGAEFLKAAAAAPLPPAQAQPAAQENDGVLTPRKKKLPVKAIAIGAVVVLVGISIYFIGALFSGVEEEIPESAWIKYTPAGFHCQLEFPGEPVIKPSTKGQARQYGLERPERASSFTITFIELGNRFDQGDLEEFFRMERDRAEDLLVTRARTQKNLKHQGHMAKEFEMVDAGGRMLAERIIWVRGETFSRLYILVVTGRFPDASSGAPARFFNSLKLPPPMHYFN